MSGFIDEKTTVLGPTTKSSTFVVRVLRTEHGTWQGRVGHVQTGDMRPFQSCLELLRIMDELVGTKDSGAKETGRNAGIVQEA
ncbi:MAG: hypothetical protein GX986_11435 [Firmicutes bacterium]|nr:hypothetical protein [Bacillota bacterium]